MTSIKNISLEKFTVTQIAAAIAAITGETVSHKSFNYKSKALERLAGLMAERHLTLRDVLIAAGIEAVTPEGNAISGLGIAAAPAKPDHKPRDSKQARLIEMLKRPGGAAIDEIVSAFGWQPHTARGVIAGALKKKLGLTIASEKIGGRRVYRIKE